ncbi:MAG: IclR family transcriptional regulator [Gaiellales bacterium]
MNPGTAGLARGLDVLVALALPEAATSGLGVVRLSELVDGDKSQLSRSLATLAEHGFVERDPATLAYRLGWRVFALATSVSQDRLLALAPAALLGLVRVLGESAHLSVREGTHVLTLLSESPSSTLHAPGRAGGLAPIATTSAGRVLAIDLGDDELIALGLEQALDAIAQARVDGFAIVREEFEPGLVAAAVPIRDATGRVIAALNVSAPGFRFDDRLEDAARLLVEVAADLSSALRGELVAQ